MVNLCLVQELEKAIRFKWRGIKFLLNMLERVLEVGRFKKRLYYSRINSTTFIKTFKRKIILNGSGRTDAGVHAHAQSAHFDCQKKNFDLTKFLKSINHFLNNKGIAITQIKKRSEKFHSRFSAKTKNL